VSPNRDIDRETERGIDVAIIGDGPAGSALARQLTVLGADVVLFGDDRPWDATYTTWVDDLDDVPVVDGADIWMHRIASVAANFERPIVVERSYGVIDNDRLRAVLRDGVAHDVGRVMSASDTGARIVVDATGWPSGLDRRDRSLLARGDLAWQTAIGVVLDEPPPGPLGTPTVMDFTDPGSTDDICVPTFVYAFPVADGWLVEETVLAGPALEPDRLLPRLASRLAESPAHLMERAIRVERVRIPMGAPVPSRPGRGHATQTATESGAAAGTTTGTVRFGAAAGMIHPATGYSVASSLRAAGRVADAVIERLGRPVDRTADAAAVVDAVWPRSLRRTRRLHAFGLEVLVGMDAAEIRGFFQTFFELPTDRWASYLRIDTPPLELARVMGAMFAQAEWSLRRQLLTGSPRSLFGVLRP
jgi:lycopene beta-cyclase